MNQNLRASDGSSVDLWPGAKAAMAAGLHSACSTRPESWPFIAKNA